MSDEIPAVLRAIAVQITCYHPKDPMTCQSCGEPLQHIRVPAELGAEIVTGDIGITGCCGSMLRLHKDDPAQVRRMYVDEFLKQPTKIQAAASTLLHATLDGRAAKCADEAIAKAAGRNRPPT